MRYASFVIRLWQIETDESAADSGFRGRIEHVQSGAVVHAADLDDVLKFIRQRMTAVVPDAEENREDQ
jgi:hypothetical protein